MIAEEYVIEEHGIRFTLYDGLDIGTPRQSPPRGKAGGTIADNNADMCRKGRQRTHHLSRPDHRGELHSAARLNAAAVRDIRASPLNSEELGAKYGVVRQTINKARFHRTWAHIT